MSHLLLFVLLGLGPGALVAALALGVVVNYRGSGVINLSVGAIVMFAAFVFYGLRTSGYIFVSQIHFGGPLATLPAFVLTLAICAALGVVLELLVMRPIHNASPLAKLVASLGVLVTLQAAVVLRFADSAEAAPYVLPGSSTVRIFGIAVGVDQFMLLGIVVAVTLVLAAGYRWTRFGLATRAAAENETVAVTSGLSPARLSMVNTLIMCLLAGAFGVIVAPLTELDSTTIALTIIPALAAALLAGFTSFSIALVSGLVLGVIQSVLLYVQTLSWFPTVGGSAHLQLPGVADLFYFVIIIAIMFWRGARLPERGAVAERRLPPAPAVRRVVAPSLGLTVLGVVAFLTFSWDFRLALINSLLGVLVCLSYVVITGFVGQLSLVQVALAGISAIAMSKLAADLGIGFPWGMLLGAGVATIFGLVTAVSALRVRGVSLAIVTMAAAVAIEEFGFDNASWGVGIGGAPAPAPRLGGLDLGPGAVLSIGDGKVPSPVFGFLCIVIVVVLAMLVALLRRSTLGRQMLAVRSDERAAAAVGISVKRAKLAAFGIASFIAGIAGSLYAYSYGETTSAEFDIVLALGFVAFAYVGGITTVFGALVAGTFVTDGLGFQVIHELTGLSTNWEPLLGGVALLVVIATHPEGVASVALKGERRLEALLAGVLRRSRPTTQADFDVVGVEKT